MGFKIALDTQEQCVAFIGGAWTNRDDGKKYLYLTSLPNPSYLVMHEDVKIYRVKFGQPESTDFPIVAEEAKRLVKLNFQMLGLDDNEHE